MSPDMSPDVILLVAGCGVFVVLGSLHGLWTLFSDRFEPRDPVLLEKMRQVGLKLTARTSMWEAWVGFNVSHSLGAVLFGLFYIVLALQHPGVLRDSLPLSVLLVSVPLIYLLLALRYWFRAPATGIFVGLLLIVASLVLRGPA